MKELDEVHEEINSEISKKQLILDQLNSGVLRSQDVMDNIARANGVIVSLDYVKNIRAVWTLGKRHAAGNLPSEPILPFAVSGITGNPIVHEYLKDRKTSTPGFLKVGVYDIETTGLYADFGYVLTIAIKDLDTGEIKSFRLDETEWYRNKSKWNDPEYWDVIDIELLDKFSQEFNQYNVLITYNGKMFDNKFLDTRILRTGLPTLNKAVKHLDMVWVARQVLKTRSKKLDAVKNFLNIDDEEDSHEWAQWRMAAAGVKEGFDFIENHNIKDVEQLHQVASRMKDHIKYIIF